MSETKENCPECGHSRYSHQTKCFQTVDVTTDYLSCSCTRTYESFVGEKAMTPDMKITFPPMIEGQTDWKVVGVGVDPELQLLVIDMGDTCVVKVEKGHWDVSTLIYPSDVWTTESVNVMRFPFSRIREAIEQKPIPRIEYRDSDYHLVWDESEVYGDKVIGGTGAFNALSELAGKPLPIWEGGVWEELNKTERERSGLSVWRYTR